MNFHSVEETRSGDSSESEQYRWFVWGRGEKKQREDSSKMSESDEIYQQVERRKQRAKSLKIPKLFEELYFHGIKFYPSWIQHSRAYVPGSISSAMELDKESMTLEMDGRKYTFRFKENRFSTPDGEMHRHGLLDFSIMTSAFSH